MSKNKLATIGKTLILIGLIINGILAYYKLNKAYDIYNVIIFGITIILILIFMVLIIKNLKL